MYFPAGTYPARGLDASQIRHYDEDAYRLRSTQTRRTPKGETKPNPKLLGHILEECGADKAKTAYVGDKLDKDVRMAQAGVFWTFMRNTEIPFAMSDTSC